MAAYFEQLLQGFADPATLFGHFTYFLLIVSMLMRQMVWLRALAVASGIYKIVYRAFFVFDPVSVLWETIFVIVNIVQLFLIWYYEYHHRFDEDETHFAQSMPTGIERQAIKRLLSLSHLREVKAGETITLEGQPVKELNYVAAGVVKIESAGRIIAVCGPGDYIGELSFLTGAPASATATAVKPVRLLAFDQEKLHAAIAADTSIRRAMESGLNRNLAGKLVRANTTHPAIAS